MSVLSSPWAAGLALCSAVAAWSALALAMDRHHADCFGRTAVRRLSPAWLRIAGALGLGVAGAVCAVAYGAALGGVYGLGLLTLAALLVVLVATLAPRGLRWLGPAAIAGGLMALLVGGLR